MFIIWKLVALHDTDILCANEDGDNTCIVGVFWGNYLVTISHRKF